MRGVVGVVGRKNTSRPSPRANEPLGISLLNIGLDGARVFVLRGRDLTRCCNCCPAVCGNSDIESNDSVNECSFSDITIKYKKIIYFPFMENCIQIIHTFGMILW